MANIESDVGSPGDAFLSSLLGRLRADDAARDEDPDATMMRILRQRKVPQIVKGITGNIEIVPTGPALCFEDCDGATIQIRPPLRTVSPQHPALARAIFVNCSRCHVRVEAKIMGSLELVRCEGTTVTLRAGCGTVEVDRCPDSTVSLAPLPADRADERPVLVNRGCDRPFSLSSVDAPGRQPVSPEARELADILALNQLAETATFFDDATEHWVRVPLEILRERDPLAIAAVKATGRSTPPPYKYYVFEVPEWRRAPGDY